MLLAGFTTTRDLGTEGSMYDDIGLKQAIEKGVVPGPHMLTATRAIVATGFKDYVAQEFIPAKTDKLKSLEEAVKICDV